MEIAATILIPTTGDRSQLLRYSVGSVLQQSVSDLEIFIVGDGVSEKSKQEIAEMTQRDSRIRFFDYPKNARRGEVHRDYLLKNEARGRIVCYLCDRDLYLPDHVERMIEALKTYDLAAMYYHGVPMQNQRMEKFAHVPFFGDSRAKGNLGCRPIFVLSSVGHTREMYLKLPFGWRETPRHLGTDHYMWEQFFSHPDCRAFSSPQLTFLYFKRGDHPGWPVEKRVEELKEFYAIIQDPQKLGRFKDFFYGELVTRNQRHSKALFLIRGYPLGNVPTRVAVKFWKLLGGRLKS